jgi:hypothetical protein
MKRYVAAAIITCAFSSPALTQESTLPKPKEDPRTSRYAGVEEGDKAKPKECCDFLCKIFIINNTGTKLKGWVRATIIGVPHFVVDLDVHLHDGIATVCPCDHPWHLWFEKIKIGVWDGEQTANVEVDFYGCCCKRRYVAEYVHGKLKLNER